MNELEQVKKRIKQLSEHVERIEQEIKEQEIKEKEKQEEEQESRYPKKGEKFYCIDSRGDEMIVAVNYHYFYDKDPDTIYAWDFLHGSKDKAKVEWTIKHIELVNEIKKYTRPFEYGEQNWYYETDVDSNRLISDFCTEYFHANEYGYFDNQGGIVKVIEQFGEEYILKFLFIPRDEDYKATMDWLAEWEENQCTD